jgi:ribonuclease P protein component
VTGHGIPKRNRLLKPEEYKRVFTQKPCRSVDDCFTILAVANAREQARLGLAIAKRDVALAVQRNRIKRIVRESFRHHGSYIKGMDLVVRATRNTANKSNGELFASLAEHWKKISQQCAAS